MDLQAIQQLDQTYYMNTFGERFPAAFERGEGCTLYDTEGKAYTDFLAGIAVNALGYNHPKFTKAICDQAHKVLHYSNLFYVESQAKLAALLIENSCMDRIFFSNSGAEANEGAIKLARKYFYEKGEKRYEIITAANSFHGRTLATLAATGQPKYHEPFQPITPSFVMAPYGDAQAIRDAITDKTCAVMLETIQGEGGVHEGGEAYLQQVRKICDDEGILLIFDEIQTGMGRTGKLFSYENYGVQPDIVTLAKALGNGIPIGAFLAKDAVADAFKPGDHGSTFGGNAFACTAGLVVVQELIDGLAQQAAETGAYFKAKLEKLVDTYPVALQARGRGLLLGLSIDAKIPVRSIALQALEAGYIIATAGGNTLRFVPPLIIEKQQIDGLIACLSGIFEQL